jgi:hypothetical protein
MATRADALPTRPPLTLVQKLVLAALILGGLGVAYYLIKPMLLGDEPPIRVRNGSVDLVLPSPPDWTGEWAAESDDWTPSKGKGSGTLLVKVESAAGFSCGAGQTGSGKEVWISYSDDPERVTLKAEGSSGKTKVRPKNKLLAAGTLVLRYGQEGAGYITGVGAKDGSNEWSCTFTAREQLGTIIICPAGQSVCSKQ